MDAKNQILLQRLCNEVLAGHDPHTAMQALTSTFAAYVVLSAPNAKEAERVVNWCALNLDYKIKSNWQALRKGKFRPEPPPNLRALAGFKGKRTP